MVKNDVLTAYFGNSACSCGSHPLEPAWEIPLTDPKYGGFAANSAYQLSVYAVHPRSFSISNIQVSASGLGFDLGDLPVRDPFILEEKGIYYLYGTYGWGYFNVYSSTDLTTWNLVSKCFEAPADFWGYDSTVEEWAFWAPEVYKYGDKYYMFATFTTAGTQQRSTILVADSPVGPFTEHTPGGITPVGHSCLDATLFVENGTPYLIYAHEWQCANGASACEDGVGSMAYVQLSSDLKSTVGEPTEWFNASDFSEVSFWEGLFGGKKDSTTTDAPFVYTAADGQKYLLWATHVKEGDDETYVQLATKFSSLGENLNVSSATTMLYQDDGGHGMVFKANGQDKMILHAPNTGNSHPVIFDVTQKNGTLSILENKTWDWYESAKAAQRAELWQTAGGTAKTTLFVGDSFFDPSQGFWSTYQADLAGKDALVLGIGGSTTEDWYNYLTKNIFLGGIAPKNLVVNLGNNDIYNDRLTGDGYLAEQTRFYNALHAAMPGTKIYAFSITKRTDEYTSSEAEARLDDANAKLKAWCEGEDKDWITFMDISKAEIVLQDDIHPVDEYYESVFLTALEAAGCQMEAAALAPFAEVVIVNSKTAASQTGKWDLSHLNEGYVVGSQESGTDWQPLYFNTSAADFAVEAIFEYDMTKTHTQIDLLAGFTFDNGSQQGYALLDNQGFVCTKYNVETYKEITTDWYLNVNDQKHTTAKAAIVKQGDNVTFFVNDVQVGTGSWATLSDGMDAAAENAVGLMMHADYAATLNVSGYKMYAGSKAAAQYIEDHKNILKGSPFAESVTVAGGTVTSKVSGWNLSQLSQGTVIGSYNWGTKEQGLYFSQTAADFAVEATFEYDLTKPDDQQAVYAGFAFHNGSQEGYAWLFNQGYTCTGWNSTYSKITDNWYMNRSEPTNAKAKAAIVKQGDKVTFLINDEIITTGDWATVSGGIDSTAQLAIGLMISTEKASTVNVSGYALYAGAEAAQQYIADHTPKIELEQDSDGYYLIKSSEHLRFMENSTEKFRLAQDITWTGTISRFSGTLDGQNHTVTTSAMLFKHLNNATVKNMTINVSEALTASASNDGVGALAGSASGATITSVTVSGGGSITASCKFVGGLVGRGGGTSFTSCTNNINVTTAGGDEHYNAGGILGGTWEVQPEYACTFTGCINNGTVTNQDTTSNHPNAGGIVGFVQTTGTVIQSCTNNGMVNAQSAGGIVGLTISGNNGTNGVQIKDCINGTDAVVNGQYIGGILGLAKDPGWDSAHKAKVIITGCYNKGKVENSATSGECSVGGIAGRMTGNVGSSISGGHNEGTVSGYKETSAIIGYQDGTCTMTGCTNTGKVIVNGFEQKELMKDADGYYQISKEEDLLALVNSSDRFRLTQNITCTETISGFNGTLDGQNHTIQTTAMLFNSVSGAEIKDLTIEVTAPLTGVSGALAGSILDSTVTDVTVTGSGSVTGSRQWVGGLVGRAGGTTFTRCTNNIAVTNTGNGDWYCAGGIVGGTYEVATVYACTFIDCVNNGSIQSNYDSNAAWNSNPRIAGGILGDARTSGTVIQGCTNNGRVESFAAGGISGASYSGVSTENGVQFTNCTNGTAALIEGNYTGGILGFAPNATWGETHLARVIISGCVNKGIVQNTVNKDVCDAGGIVGRMIDNKDSTITNCRNEGTVQAAKEAAAIIGCKAGGTVTHSGCTNTGAVITNGQQGNNLTGYWQ